MGEPKIGDKIFLYGQFLRNLEEFGEYEYNSVIGYATVGGYFVNLVESDQFSASVPGFLVDFWSTACLAGETSFGQKKAEMIDVSEKMSMQSPQLLGTKVWMPVHIQDSFSGIG